MQWQDYHAFYRDQTVPGRVYSRPLGSHPDDSSAQRKAESLFPDNSAQLVEVRILTGSELFWKRVARFAIRSIRILVALVLFVIGLEIFSGGQSMWDTPFSQLTLGMLIGGLVKAGFQIGGIYICWIIAFGSGPKTR